MTQKHFRKAAGMGWVTRAWSRLHEPRIVSAVYGAAYTLATAVGIWCTIAPPQSIEGITGRVLMAIITGIIAVGGGLGVITTARGIYWAERAAAWLIITGLSVWGGMTIYLQFVGSGNRGMTIMAALFGIALFGLRFTWIGDRPYNPRSHPVPPEPVDQ